MEERIVSAKEAPEWMIDNYYLLTGYRVGFKTPARLLRTLFMKHNELLNIWTHLIGSLIFIGLFYYIIVEKSKEDMHTPEWVLDFKSIFGNLAQSLKKMHRDVQSLSQPTTRGMLASADQSSKIHAFFGHSKQTWMVFLSGLSHVLAAAKDNIEGWELHMIKNFEFTFKNSIDDILGFSELDVQNENYSSLANLRDFQVSVIMSDFKVSVTTSLESLLERVDSILFKLFRKRDIKHLEENGDPGSAIPPLESSANPDSSEPPTAQLELYPIWVFCLCAFFCLCFSTIFHIFFPISFKVNRVLQRLDHAGISILIFGSSFTIYYYYFYCNMVFKILYSVIISVACFSCFFISLMDFIHRPEYTKIKSVMYASLGLSNVVPFLHMCVLSWYASPHNPYIPFNISFFLLFIMALIYLVGLAIYTYNIPERFYPKKFDIWMNSHTIWHCLVFAAAFVHYQNLLIVYNLRKNRACLT